MMAGPEGTTTYVRCRGRPIARQSVAEQVLRGIRSRGPSGESDRDRGSGGGGGRRLSCDEIDFILGDIRRRRRSSSSRPPPPSSLPPDLPPEGDPSDGTAASDWLPFGPKGQKERRKRGRKRPKSEDVAGSHNEGRARQGERERAGAEWRSNPLYEAKPHPRNANPLPAAPDKNGGASSNAPGSPTFSSLPSSSKHTGTELANDPASCAEGKKAADREDRGKDLNERLNGGEGGAEPMDTVRRLKERLRDMSEELDRVKRAADKISLDIDELNGGDPEAVTKEGGGECAYLVEEPEEEEEWGMNMAAKGGGVGLVITEVASPTPASKTPPIRPRPFWGEEGVEGEEEEEGGEGGDLFGKRYALLFATPCVTHPRSFLR